MRGFGEAIIAQWLQTNQTVIAVATRPIVTDTVNNESGGRMQDINGQRRAFHLDAHSSRRLAQRQNRVVLGSVQPVDSQFSAGGPFHHGDVILSPEKHAE